MFLEIQSLDGYPHTVIRHHDCCNIGASIETVENADNFSETFPVRFGPDEAYEITIEDCECPAPELNTRLDTRDPNEIPF